MIGLMKPKLTQCTTCTAVCSSPASTQLEIGTPSELVLGKWINEGIALFLPLPPIMEGMIGSLDKAGHIWT